MKYHPHNSTLFVTFSIEQGLLLLCNPLCEAIIKSCLARAQFLYPVRICAFMIEATHVHITLVVINPVHVQDFVRHFKTESAHALNAILGRKKRTIWCEGYDSPIVLTPLRTLLVLCYIYTNPVKDNLEESIDKYPGVSSWKMFRKGVLRKKWKRLHRPAYHFLRQQAHNLQGYTREAARLLSDSKSTHEFVLEPNAWMESFGITDKNEQDRLNQKIIDRVRTVEERYRQVRARAGMKVIGASRLQNEPLNTTHLSERNGRRMRCLSDDRDLRIRFICFLKDLITKARAVRARWAVGDYRVPYPMGLHPPSQPKLVEPLSIW